MNYFLTKYIYPLENKVHLSKTLGYSLDNPRNIDEIESIKNIIKNNFDGSLSPFSDIVDIGVKSISLDKAFELLTSLLSNADNYANQRLKQYEDDPLKFISSSIILLRNEKSYSESIWYNAKKEKKEDEEEFKNLNNYLANKSLNEYISLLSFIINYDEDNFGATFLSDDSLNENSSSLTGKQLSNVILLNGLYNSRNSEIFKHGIFLDQRDDIIKYSRFNRRSYIK